MKFKKGFKSFFLNNRQFQGLGRLSFYYKLKEKYNKNFYYRCFFNLTFVGVVFAQVYFYSINLDEKERSTLEQTFREASIMFSINKVATKYRLDQTQVKLYYLLAKLGGLLKRGINLNVVNSTIVSEYFKIYYEVFEDLDENKVDCFFESSEIIAMLLTCMANNSISILELKEEEKCLKSLSIFVNYFLRRYSEYFRPNQEKRTYEVLKYANILNTKEFGVKALINSLWLLSQSSNVNGHSDIKLINLLQELIDLVACDNEIAKIASNNNELMKTLVLWSIQYSQLFDKDQRKQQNINVLRLLSEMIKDPSCKSQVYTVLLDINFFSNLIVNFDEDLENEKVQLICSLKGVALPKEIDTDSIELQRLRLLSSNSKIAVNIRNSLRELLSQIEISSKN